MTTQTTDLLGDLVSAARAEATITDLLDSTDEVRPGYAPTGTPMPYLIIDVDDDPSHYHHGGIAAIRDPSVSCTAIARSYTAASDLADAVEAWIEGLGASTVGSQPIRGVFKASRRVTHRQPTDGSDEWIHEVELVYDMWRAT